MSYDRMIAPRTFLVGVLGASVLQLVACSDDSASGGTGATGGGGGGGSPPEVCDSHAIEATPSFTDTTEGWGLGGVAGGRVMSGDVNGDGYPDLIVHGFTANARETIGEGTRLIYLLLNEPAEGGRRQFVDRTFESGFAAPADGSSTELKASHFAVLADVDNDGDLDVFSGTYSDLPLADPPSAADLDRSEIYLNDGAGAFTIVEASGVEFQNPLRTSSGTFTDVDHDGVVDLFVGVHYSATGAEQAPALYHGNGDGTFTDISLASAVKREKRATFGVASCDLDNDGNPELLMSAYARGPDVLFHATDLGYEDLGEASGFAFDELTDYTDNQFFLCWCTANEDDEDCAGVEEPALVCPDPPQSYWSSFTDTKPDRLGGNGFSAVCRDIDGDGNLDIYNAQIAHWWAGQSSDKSNVLFNRGGGEAGKFEFEWADREAMGLLVPHPTVDWNEGGIVTAVGDLDGDGRTDIMLGASDYPDQYSWVYRQKEDGTFEEVGEELGIHHPCAVGITTADFDRDGDLDVVIASGTARDCAAIWSTNEVHFYENGGEAANHWLAIRLVGGGAGAANTAGIGARVSVTAGGVTQVQEHQRSRPLRAARRYRAVLFARWLRGRGDGRGRLAGRGPNQEHLRGGGGQSADRASPG